MTLFCKNCASKNLYCISCKDDARVCEYEDHYHKCMNCKNIQKSTIQKKPKVKLCPLCEKIEGIIEGKLKAKKVKLCTYCAYDKLKEHEFVIQ